MHTPIQGDENNGMEDFMRYKFSKKVILDSFKEQSKVHSIQQSAVLSK